jgi:hypothetical protein
MRAQLRRLLRVGMGERVPAREAKHVILTNAITLIAVVQLVPLAGLALAAGLRLVVYWILGCSLAFLTVLAVSEGRSALLGSERGELRGPRPMTRR